MASPRYFHTATAFPDGRVLVAGGRASTGSGTTDTAGAEWFDPATNNWSTTGSLSGPRVLHSATLLADGKLLVAGGSNGSSLLSSAERFDPIAGTWTPAGSMSTVRRLHSATVLHNGKVLVAGGVSDLASVAALRSAEVFDPGTGTWSSTNNLGTDRGGHVAVQLPSGKVLVATGFSASAGALTRTAELWDPMTGTWTPTGMVNLARERATATLLPGGRVLLTGGWLSGAPTTQSEIYDPVTGTWSSTSPMVTARTNHSATALPGGKVMVAGGDTGSGLTTASVEVYDPAGRRWTNGAALGSQRTGQSATLLPDGRVLVAGGSATSSGVVATAEIFDPAPGTQAAWRPQISTATFDATDRVVLTGTAFRGVTSGAGAAGASDSPTNFPVVQLREVFTGLTQFLPLDPTTHVSPTGFTSKPVLPFLGPAIATVMVNGIPGSSFLVSGTTLRATRDTDGDGLSDAAELQLASLGFDWKRSQPELVGAMVTNLPAAQPLLNSAGYYTTAQIQALNVGTPLLTADGGGVFRLTLGVQKSSDLQTFAPFPMSAPQTLINGQGKLEFWFTVPDSTAFFRVEASP